MPSRHVAAESLADIICNADRVEQYLLGVDSTIFAERDVLRDAVERCIERVCEAAHRLGPQAPLLMPDQPWPDIRGMGNQLRHAYDRISPEVIWHTATRDLPALAADARRALSALEPC